MIIRERKYYSQSTPSAIMKGIQGRFANKRMKEKGNLSYAGPSFYMLLLFLSPMHRDSCSNEETKMFLSLSHLPASCPNPY